MKYFVPKVKLSSELPVQTRLEEKFGGVPWGLTLDQVPVCTQCEKHQTLIVQLLHHPIRLDLGASGRVLFVFQCQYGCNFWEGGAGANACFVLDDDELTHSPSLLPEVLLVHPTDVVTEVRIVDWVECEDGVTAEQFDRFFDEQKHSDLPDELFDRLPQYMTRLGGVPIWCQSADEAPKGWQFVGQLEESQSTFEVPLGQKWESHRWDPGTWYERRWFVGNHNFGCGSAYIFLRRHGSEKPEGWFFSQC